MLGLGELNANKYKFTEAIPYFEKAVVLKPDFTDAYNGLGICYWMMKDLRKACDYYIKCISIDSTQPVIYGNIGWLLIDIGDYSLSFDYLKKAYQMTLDYSNRTGSIGERTKIYLKALFLGITLTFFKSKDFDRAKELMTAVLEDTPEFKTE